MRLDLEIVTLFLFFFYWSHPEIIAIGVSICPFSGALSVHQQSGDVAQLVERRTGMLLTQVRFPGVVMGFVFQSQLSMQSLLQRPYSPSVKSHA